MKNIYLLLIVLLVIESTAFAQEKEEFKPSGKVLMDVFGDYYYKLGSDVDSVLSGGGEYQKTPKEYNAFAFRRVYLGYEYNFTEKFYAKIMIEGADALKLGDSKRAATIKFAYFEWKEIFPGSKLIVGSQSTTIWEAPEKVWGYRAVEKTIADFRKIGTPSDVGIALQGKIDSKGTFGYHVMVANGTAVVPEKDKYKKFYGTLNANFIDNQLIIELHGNYEKTSDSGNISVTKGFVGFDHKYFSIGLEEVIQLEEEGNETITSVGTSIFARGNIIEKKLSAFVRLDIFNDNIDEKESGDVELFTVLGIDFKPVKQINIIPNIWINNYNPKASGAEGRKPDVLARITFRYKL